MERELRIPLFIESTRYGANRKHYLLATPEGQQSPVPEVITALDQVCGKCPLRFDCLPTRSVANNGKSLIFIGSETTNPKCNIYKDEEGAIVLDLRGKQDPLIQRSPLARILGQ